MYQPRQKRTKKPGKKQHASTNDVQGQCLGVVEEVAITVQDDVGQKLEALIKNHSRPVRPDEGSLQLSGGHRRLPERGGGIP